MKEEITYIISDEAYDDPNFKKGLLLKMEKANIVITRVDRKNKRTWGRHIQPVNQSIATTHYGHNIDTTEEIQAEFGAPYCTDCEVPLNEQATVDGKRKANERDENTLSDGTVIDE